MIFLFIISYIKYSFYIICGGYVFYTKAHLVQKLINGEDPIAEKAKVQIAQARGTHSTRRAGEADGPF